MPIAAPVRQRFREHPRVADAVIAAVVFLLAVLIRDPDREDGPDLASLTAGAVPIAVLTCAALVLRRERPVAVLGATIVGMLACDAVVGERTFISFAPLVALYTVAVRGERRTTRLAWVATATAVLANEAITQRGLTAEVLGELAWSVAAAALGDGLGHRRAYLAAVEERAVRAEQGREEESRRRVAEERLRIARELHDVVAHHMAVVNVQAGVAGHLLPDHPEAAQEALGHVRRAAGEILGELGDILNVLRQGEDTVESRAPAPGLEQLDTLVTSFTAAGLTVDWSLTGRPRPLGGGVDLVAYRVLQEALTNAHKHGTGTARVSVAYRPDEVRLEVSNPVPDGAADADPGPGSGGHGLVGMRERASAVGGSVALGPDPDGRFHVRATLPVPAAS